MHSLAAGPLDGMPNDNRPRGFVARLATLSRIEYSAHANHMIAISRMVCAFILLLFALTDGRVPGFHRDYNDVFALAFAGFAIATLIVSLWNWHLDFTLSETFIVVDGAAFFLLLAPHTAFTAASVAMALCLIAHILFSSVMRWRLKFGIAIAALLNAVWIGDFILFELPRGGIDEGDALRWSLVAFLVSVIVIWAGTQMAKTSLPRFVGAPPVPGFPLTTSAVGYAMRTACASNAILCWIDRENLDCYASSAAAIQDERVPVKLGFRAADAFRKLSPMLFDTAHGRAIVSEGGGSAAHSAGAVPGYGLFKELEVETGICLPVDDDEGRSWLVLTGIPMLGWGHLNLVHAITAEIAQGMAWQTSSANALDLALSRLRRTIASDLHDSVAHSLAGAKFLLVALESKVGAESDTAKEIDTVKDALEAEYLHVRMLIEQLRQDTYDVRVRNLIEDIAEIGPALESRWQIEVELVESDFRIDVPVWISLEIQQIVREAISNAVRHGGASTVSIKCQKRSRKIIIEVTDNGSGFANRQMPAIPRSISERLGELGGSLKIDSKPGSTTLRMSVPASAAD